MAPWRTHRRSLTEVEDKLNDVATRLETVTDRLEKKVQELRDGGEDEWPDQTEPGSPTSS
jgi:hypothetical protein